MRKKKKEKIVIPDLEITDFAAEGKAMGKDNGLVIFVEYAVPGDVVDVEIFKKKKGYAEGRIVTLRKESPLRQNPICEHFGLCGGCRWQNLSYQQQLLYKQKMVDDHFKHIGKFEYPPLSPIVPSEKEFYYRNKLEFTFTDLRWLSEKDMILQQQNIPLETNGLGFHIPKKFDKILDIKNCFLQESPSNEIRLAVKKLAIDYNIPFYNIRNHDGTLRNIIIRTSSTGKVMVIVVFKRFNEDTKNLLLDLASLFPQITSLQYVINDKLNDSITDLEPIVFKGLPYITEKIGDLSFRLDALSFFQTNHEQMCQLYKIGKEFANLTSQDLVYDLYCGIGTISCYIAKDVKKVIGLEYVDSAVENARLNAQLNGITNVSFFAGDIAKVLTPEFVQQNGKPTVVITDPPRTGMHTKVIEQLLAMLPEKIVYISCNSATQARDITLLNEKYKVTKVQPVDMFPQTQHVENVALLEKREEI
jgi:23S rRNA (uracil1939-C5)-methyltransferase